MAQVEPSAWRQVDIEDEEEGVELETDPHSTPEKEILWAAENNKINILKKLLSEDTSLVNAKDSDLYTPLHRACYNGHVQAIDILLEHGAKIDARTEEGWQPLHSACRWNQVKCAARLIQCGADINAQTDGGQTPLHLASSHKNAHDLLGLLLLQPYINLELENDSHETPLQVARGNAQYAELFELANPSINNIEQPDYKDEIPSLL